MALYLATWLQPWWPLAQYWLQQEHIIAEKCQQRIPMCQGRCFLADEIGKAASAQSASLEASSVQMAYPHLPAGQHAFRFFLSPYLHLPPQGNDWALPPPPCTLGIEHPPPFASHITCC
ncbi:hypothetical protein [Phaeodactylibacter luteus]|uniref:Uncharacterized protein n=1 Tax=Phaeodactylibacter luteus TaxID=1564516 RepID=A0A5C6RLW6_9BACT|nr:hypothetical protein [Phaeodactylibacter luteus]TXB63358.1 hypothetical protein FRY97_09295 [Phaeodactylibacter luteus]